MFGSSDSETSSLNASGDSQTSQAGNTAGTNVSGPKVSGSGKYVTNSVRVDAQNKSNNQGIILEGSSNNITLSDHGAISGAFEFGNEALTAAFGFGNDALYMADLANERAADQTMEAMGAVTKLSQGQQEAAAETNKEIGRLAESLATDGASRNKTLIVVAVVGVAAVAGIVIMAKAKK